MQRRRYLNARYSHAGRMGAHETPNNNLDTTVPRANRHHSIITALDSSTSALDDIAKCGVRVSCW